MNPVYCRVDGEIVRSSEIGFFKDSMVKGCTHQIAVVEGRSGQVGAGEICFLEIAIGEFCVFQVQSLEVG